MIFEGKLRSNEIFGALYNMIISQEVFADNIKGDDLVDQAKVDGGLFGDTKLYYSTDVLSSSEWGNDAEAESLLKLHRPAAPEVQAIVLDKFRQISLTVDDYLSKRAWSDEGAFGSFNSVMTGWLHETKKVYDATTYNCFLGTVEGEAAIHEVSVTVGAEDNEGQVVAQAIADLITEMSDYNRDYNGYGQLRRYSESEIKVIFNAKEINKIKNIDLPVIFDNAGLKATFSREVLPSRYFGTVNTGAVAGDGSTVRSLVEQVIGENHYFPGDIIKTTDTAPAGTSYTQDDKIIAKVLVKLPPYMSSFEVGTSFFNPKSLTENKYLTYGHNTLEALKNYPLVTIKKA